MIKFPWPFIEALLHILYPGRCLLCGRLFRPSGSTVADIGGAAEHEAWHRRLRGLIKPLVCPSCTKDIRIVESPICHCCGAMFKSREGKDHLCGDCLESPKKFTIARSPGIYDGALMEVIHRLKYHNKIQLAGPMELFLFEYFLDTFDPETVDGIIPVPLHPRRMRQRGFNQSYLLVRHWEQWAVSCGAGRFVKKVRRDILFRKRWTPPQTGLGRKARLKNLNNAFGIADRKRVRGKRLLLVDDVYTTGATVGACAKVLMASGAEQVQVLTLARAL